MIVRIVGAILLVAMGIGNFVRKSSVSFPVATSSGKWLMAGKGFMLNFFNPGNFISWLSVSVLLVDRLQFPMSERITFYAGALTAIFLAELGIAYSARYLKRFITNQFLHWLNMALGVVFCCFGIALLWPLLKKILMS
jgi:threonine/homoserine/homoserine lactone efflux protein